MLVVLAENAKMRPQVVSKLNFNSCFRWGRAEKRVIKKSSRLWSHVCTCCVNHPGEMLLKGRTWASCGGVRTVEQHQPAPCPWICLPHLVAKSPNSPPTSGPPAPVHPYVHPSAKPMSGWLLCVCVCVCHGSLAGTHTAALTAGAGANLIFNSTRLLG